MKRLIYPLLLVTLTACHPTEANYRKSYETVKAHSNEVNTVDGTYTTPTRLLSTSEAIISKGDTIPLMTVAVKLSSELEVPNTLTKYSVALGQFKQRFNAKSLMTRVQQSGYQDATIVENSEPIYYVIIPGAETPEESAELFRRTKSLQDSIAVKPPYPVILTSSRR